MRFLIGLIIGWLIGIVGFDGAVRIINKGANTVQESAKELAK